MCGSINSSKWAELERSINTKTGMEQEQGNNNKWWDDKEFWEDLNEVLLHAKLVKFGGGEPLLLKQHKDVLKFLRENNPNCTIKYITNANNITQEYIDLWQDLPNLKFVLSIDGIKDRLEYLRWPIKWDTLINNIRMLKQLKTKPKISINYTMSLFNILYMNEDLNWFLPRLDDLGIDHLNPNFVHFPNFLHAGLLPDEIKKTINIKYAKDLSIADTVQSYLKDQTYNKDLLKQFAVYAKQLDAARGTNVLKTFPKLINIL
jgi:MoaA/NifB/PqqE/SkfB family radical SAM enzyme